MRIVEPVHPVYEPINHTRKPHPEYTSQKKQPKTFKEVLDNEIIQHGNKSR